MQEQTSNKGEMGDETGLLLCSTYIFVPLKYICDWILENLSKSHIRRFKINSFKNYNWPREVSTLMKFMNTLHQFITLYY